MKNIKSVLSYIYGEGSLSELEGLLEKRRTYYDSTVVFVIDEFFKDKNIESRLPINEWDIVIFASTKNEPHADYIDLLVEEIKSKRKYAPPVAVVGMGGGTTMDISKCISILLTNPGKAEEYQGWDLVKNPGIYKIGIPTLSGTGAESSRTAVITSRIKKLGINSDHSTFDQVVLDSELLATVPKQQFFYTAMDCYIHCVESLRGNLIDEMSKAYAHKSLELMREVFKNPEKIDYGKLMVASYFGGYAIANSNVGVCHPISYGLSLVLGLHHGEAVSVAFDKLEEYYKDEVKEFREIMVKHNITLPQGFTKKSNPEDFEKMIDAILKNEKPLTNAFGENWKEIFTRDKVRQILNQI